MQKFILALCLFGSASAFAPVRPTAWTARSIMAATPTEEAYAAAEEATKKFGITSPEARLAWETVDDMEDGGGAVDAATMAMDSLSSEAKVKEFEAKMAKLEELTSAAKTVNIQIKSEILKIQGLKMGDTVAAAAAVSSEAYQSAKAEAEAAAEKHGADSAEAKVAWEAVFEIVSAADDDKVNMNSLEDECLISSSAKCVDYQLAMDELRAAIINSESSSYSMPRD